MAWTALTTIALVLALAGCAAGGASVAGDAPAPMTASPHRSSSAPWLGINYNSSSVGPLRLFSRLGITYDRDGGLETTAGQLARGDSELARALNRTYGAGMTPDVLVDPANGPSGCTGNPSPGNLCLPTTTRDISGYASGFVATMRSVLAAHPGRSVLFEPMDEPWDWGSPPGTLSGRRAATEYAAVLAAILRRTVRAGMSLTRIYVPAIGTPLADGTHWISDLYAAQPCLKPGPHSCGPIEAWNAHPYGRPGLTTEGVDSLPPLRAQMLSGANNVIASEIGFCATDVARGADCNEASGPDIVTSSTHAAAWLSQTLQEAAPMHRAGWLKALILWERGGSDGVPSGWAMQNTNGSLTDQGRALERFAASRAGR